MARVAATCSSPCTGQRHTDLYRKSPVLAVLSLVRCAAVEVRCFEVLRIRSVSYTRSKECAPRAHLLRLQR